MIRPLFAAVWPEQLYLVRLYFAALWRRKKNNRGSSTASRDRERRHYYPTRKCASFPARERFVGSSAGAGAGKGRFRSALPRLKDLIDRQLIVQSFHKEKFELPEHFVDERVNDIIQSDFAVIGPRSLKRWPPKWTLTGSRRTRWTKSSSRDAEQERKTHHSVSPAKVDGFYKQHRAELTSKEQVKLRMIMIPTAPRKETRSRKSDRGRDPCKLADGAPFDRMAQMYSEDRPGMPEAIGWIDARRWRGMEKRRRSSPRARQPRDRARSRTITFEGGRKTWRRNPSFEIRPEIEKKLMQEEEQKQQELWIAGLRQKAYIRTF